MIIKFIIETVITCILFTLFTIPYLLKNPLAWFYDYPVEVQEHMRSLLQYEGKIPTKKHSDIKKKLLAFVVCLILFAAITYYSGATTFDMVKEYENPKIHWIGFFKGSIIGIVFALLVGCLIALLSVITA